MATARNPLQVLKEAKQIAKDNGCFIQEKAGKYHVYRATQPKPTYLGNRGDVAALRSLVCRVTGFK